MTDRLLLMGVIGFASGIVCRSLFVFSLPLVLLLVLLVAALGALSALRRAPVYGVSAVFITLLALGMARAELAPTSFPDAFLPLVGTKVELIGTVVTDPDLRETSQRVTVAAVHEGEKARVLVVMGLHPELQYGDTVTVAGKLTLPKPFETDGGREFRYDRFLAKDGIFGLIEYAQVGVVESPRGSALFRGTLFRAKHAFVDGLASALPEPYASLAAGIIAGGKQGLGKELLEAFTIAGLLPIIVLSGYNVMIVAEMLLRGLAFLPKRFALAVAALAILLFVLAAGTGASAVRAGIMAGLALFARATGRTYDALRALVLVLVLMLAANPLLLVYDPGFQFSFAATLGLIIGAPLIEPYLRRVRNDFMRDIIATTLAAQLFVLPILLYQTGNLSLVALPANILVLPLVPFAMLFSAIAGLVGLLAPALAPLFGTPALALLWCITTLAEAAAALPLAHVLIPAFPFWVVLMMYVLLGYVLVWIKTQTFSEGRPHTTPP